MNLVRINSWECIVGDWVIYKYGNEVEEITSIEHNTWEEDECILNGLVNNYEDIITVRLM